MVPSILMRRTLFQLVSEDMKYLAVLLPLMISSVDRNDVIISNLFAALILNHVHDFYSPRNRQKGKKNIK